MKYPRFTSALLTISFISLCLFACGPKQKTDQEKVASLPDLPQADVDKLKVVPNSRVLATSQVLRQNAPPVTTPPPPCPADGEELDYTAQVVYPITTCNMVGSPPEGLAGFYIDRQGPTSRVADSRLSSEVHGALSDTTFGGWWACRTDKGPWQGYLTESHLCEGTCATVFSLALTNAPNLIVFSWFTRLDNHNFVPNFQFVAPPTFLNKTDHGLCH